MRFLIPRGAVWQTSHIKRLPCKTAAGVFGTRGLPSELTAVLANEACEAKEGAREVPSAESRIVDAGRNIDFGKGCSKGFSKTTLSNTLSF